MFNVTAEKKLASSGACLACDVLIAAFCQGICCRQSTEGKKVNVMAWYP